MDRRWLTAKEASEYLGLHLKTIYRLTTQRKIPFTKVPGIGIRVDIKELNALMERREEIPREHIHESE